MAKKLTAKFPLEKKILALVIIALLGLFLLYSALPLIAGIVGSALLYVLLKPSYLKVLRITGNKTFSAFLVMVLSFILIIIPLAYLLISFAGELGILISELPTLLADVNVMLASIHSDLTKITEFLQANAQGIAEFLISFIIIALNEMVGVALNLVIMYLILYFALTENERASAAMKRIIPFSEKNATKLMAEFVNVIKITFIGNGAASLALGLLLALGLYAVGIHNFVFWLIVGTILAFIPIVGIQIIWIPIGIYLLVTGEYVGGTAIIVWGAFLSYIADGFVRQKVQKDIGEMHPLISLIGIIIGITYFGVIGIIIGPMILTFFYLMAVMFRDEYIDGW